MNSGYRGYAEEICSPRVLLTVTRTGSKPTCFFLLSTVLRGIPRVERAVPIRAKFLALREVDGRAPAEQPLDAEHDANPLGDAARRQVRRSES